MNVEAIKNDLELTMLCAEAMEPRAILPGSSSIWGVTIDYIPEKRVRAWVKGGYNPLRNDAQAMALVKKFELEILPNDLNQFRVRYANRPDSVCIQNLDLNRAIVECVARMYERAS